MTVVLARNWGNNVELKGDAVFRSGNFVLKKKKLGVTKSGGISLKAVIFIMAGCIIFSGILYLYQVNSIAIQGYEIKDMENRIRELEKESQKLKIQEVESKSMYNIEKATEDLNLVNTINVSYVEMKGPVAMR